MEGVLSVLNSVMNWVTSLKSAAMIPIFLFIVAVIFGVKPGRALRSSLIVGCGFVGIGAITDLFFTSLEPVTEALVLKYNLALNVIDVGWAPYMSAIWATPIATIMLPLFLIVNIILLIVKFTDTVDIDVWNYCLCFYAGALVYVTTGHNLLLACIGVVLSEMFVLKGADIIAPKTEEYFGLPGISFPHVSSLSFLPVGWVLAKLLDKIPFLEKIHADPETLRKKFGVFGETVFIGTVIGLVVALLSGATVADSLGVAITMAGVMFLLPRMVSVLVEGLNPLAESISERMQSLLPGRNIRIGLDTAITIGNPSTLAVGIVLVPCTLLLAAILPWNTTIPFADLSSIPFMLCLITPYVKGDVVKLFIIGLIIVAFIMLPLGSLAAPAISTIIQEAGIFSLPEGFGSATLVTSFLDGSNPLSFVIWKILELIGKIF